MMAWSRDPARLPERRALDAASARGYGNGPANASALLGCPAPADDERNAQGNHSPAACANGSERHGDNRGRTFMNSMKTSKAAIIGGGKMGCDIAAVLAARGWDVHVQEPELVSVCGQGGLG